MQRFREFLTLLLLTLLPFHALLVTVVTRILEGQGHAPLQSIAIWKEAVLALILLSAVFEIILLLRTQEWKRILKPDLIDLLIILLVLLGVFVTATRHGDWNLFLYGFKYDFLPLTTFLFLRRLPWSETFTNFVQNLLAVGGALVVVIGIVFLIFPLKVLTFIGYSELHSLYVPDAPLAAFQQIGELGLRRMQGPLSGPNQFGIWLLLPLGIVLVHFIHSRGFGGGFLQRVLKTVRLADKRLQHVTLVYLCFLLLGILCSFSRSVWLATFFMFAIVIAYHYKNPLITRVILRTVAFLFFILILVAILEPKIYTRFFSTKDHFIKPLEAMMSMAEMPNGRGLGTAGPASNRVSDACVFLASGSDASWASDRQDLCVFVGDHQIQPKTRTCRCPVHTENWYLQIGIEMGFIGFILFLSLVIVIIRRLLQAPEDPLTESILLTFVGVSIAALFLHAWEDAAVAYSVWLLLATVLTSYNKENVSD